MHTATIVLIVLAAGLASQWLASLLKMPAIVILILGGLVLGPFTGVLEMQATPEQLTELIGLGVAIILFEGGLDLKLKELKKAGPGIGRLVFVVPPLTWIMTATAAHYVVGMSWAVASVFGAILVVTGPTVIQPILRYARLNDESSSLLKWEGIVNDPVGVLLAVLTFQFFTVAGEGMLETVGALGGAIVLAAALGGGGGWLVAKFFQRGAVPEHLKPPLLMVLVLLVYKLGNAFQHEAGLLCVTLMGTVVGNVPLAGRRDLQRFKENLTIVLVSVLFIVITARLEIDQILLLDWKSAALIALIVFLIRPVAVLVATIGARMRGSDRILLAWMAPRGIVAAATAGVFGPAMVEAGYADADVLLPLIFAVILVTVVLHGLTMGLMGRRLGLAAEDDNGLLIVGASPFSLELARVIQRHDIEVLIVDGVYRRLKEARMAGIETYYGEILSEHAEHTLETHHLGYLFCATANDFYNALVCNALGPKFGRHRSLQLATDEGSDDESRQLTQEQRGFSAFAEHADYDWLQRRLDDGWTIQGTKLSDVHDLEKMDDALGERGEDWLLIGAIDPRERPRLYSVELPFDPEAGWTVLYFAPPRDDDDDASSGDGDEDGRTEPDDADD